MAIFSNILNSHRILPVFVVLVFFTAGNGFIARPTCSSATALESFGFSSEEIAWLKEHPVVRLAPDPDFPPIEFIDKDGKYCGIAADFIKLIEAMLPIKFEIVHLRNWQEVIAQGKAKTIDMFGAAVPTPERLTYMSFTKPYVEFPAVVLVRDSADGFPVLSELSGKRVAVVSNYADHEYMVKAYPKIPLEIMPDISSGLRQVSFGKVDAMVLNLASASYYIQKDGISNLKVTEDTDFVFDLSFAGRSDWPELTSILEKTMAAISPADKKAVLDSWISLGNKPWRPSLLAVLSFFALGLVLMLFAILYWNHILKKQVRERTAELEWEYGERLQAEKEKVKLQQQVYRAKKMEALGLLAGGVAHDLNNILSGTVGYSDLLMKKIPEDSPLTHFIKGIHDSGRRAAAVVADLLTISRDAATDRRTVNLNAIIMEYFNSPEHQSLTLRYPDIQFKTDLAEDLHNLSCSVTHIKKCIMNLVTNAAEATLLGTVIVRTVNSELTDPVNDHDSFRPGQYLLMSVIDDGPGISSEDVEHVFEPFYTKKKMGHSGTGLGLTIVWSTVLEHQGFIEIKRPAVGSHFKLYFPASEKMLDNEVLSERSETKGNGEHVLIVDDEESVRTLAEKLLIDLGYSVSVVSSGEEAISFLKRKKADLLLLDMLMEPGMNGFQTYQKIKTFIPHQKALITSGFSESYDVKQAQELGAGAYVRKPYTLQELGLAVRMELAN
ncbi:MAG: transporter substrate-binding domain-containing protein [Desulforhopalus sp.]